MSFVVTDYRDILLLKQEFDCDLPGADRALQAERPYHRGEDILKMAYKPTLCGVRIAFNNENGLLWQVTAVCKTMRDLHKVSRNQDWNYGWLVDQDVPKIGDFVNIPREGLLPKYDFFEVNYANGQRAERWLNWEKLRASLMEDMEAGRAFTVHWRLFCSVGFNRVRIPCVAFDPHHLMTHKQFWNTMF
jgi:hypothetical protein